MKQCFTTQNKFNCEYCITNAGDREFGITNGSSHQLGHTALAGDQIDAMGASSCLERWPTEDLAPLRHMMEARRSEKDSWHRIKPIVFE